VDSLGPGRTWVRHDDDDNDGGDTMAHRICTVGARMAR
jgi:hypothetical protein